MKSSMTNIKRFFEKKQYIFLPIKTFLFIHSKIERSNEDH